MPTKSTITTLNAVCPYFTMFPLDFPLNVLDGVKSGGWVLDPFCGRGTTNYASRLMNFNTVGVDSNPVAVAIAEGKLVSALPSQIVERAEEILFDTSTPSDIPEGEFWEWAYHPQVLEQICKIRKFLLTEPITNIDKALRAVMLGSLHGHILKTTKSYFSNQCQRTYSPKPAYAVKFWKERNMRPPLIDVMQVIKKRAEHFYSNLPPDVSYRFFLGDSRDTTIFDTQLGNIRFDWIITSPPYYGMQTYLADHWLRLWFMGNEPVVNYDKSGQLKHTGKELFASELRQVWLNVELVSTYQTTMVIRFGALPSIKSDPLQVLEDSLENTRWAIQKKDSAGFSSDGKRQAYQQAKNRSNPIEEWDVWVKFA